VQARQVAGMVANNASFNCNAAKVLVTSKDWPQRQEFMDAVYQALSEAQPRKAYYPGAQQRYRGFLERYPKITIELGCTDRAIDLLKKGFEAGDTSPSTPYNLGVAYGRRFDATGDQEARRYAVAALTRAQTSCKAATDAARCAATRDRIARLELLKPN
jgi:hypothetical protein